MPTLKEEENVRQTSLMVLVLTAAFLAPGQALTQSYPSKPIRFILNSSVGVSSDIVMRVAIVDLAKQMGQPWVIDNRPGGNFVIGAVACKSSAPDGYTVCLVNEQAMSLNPHVISKLPYDPDSDFKAITNLYVQVSGVAGAASLPVSSIGELLRLAATKPGSMNFATLGPGTTQDILRQWMNNNWKTEFVGVPYKGMNLILNGLVTGEVSLTQTSLGSAAAYLNGGKVKLLAIQSFRRLPKLPEVPTFAEAGLGEFTDVQGPFWWGLVAPAGTPDPIVQRVNAEVGKVFRLPKFTELLEIQYLESVVGTPEEFASFLKLDRARFAQMVKRFNIPRE
jgi:tripartite-type tricarboxylate transporter receptor subunit TctC